MIIVVAMTGYVIIPAEPSMAMVAVVLMLLFCVGIFAMRGIYFAPMDECKVPKTLTGTAVGIISVIGFFPDVFMNTIAGALMDAHPGPTGYKYLFMVMLAFAVVGTIASLILNHMVKKQRSLDQKTTNTPQENN